MTSPTGTDGNTLWEQGLTNVLAAKPMDRNQFLDLPWISLVKITRESHRKSPWNYPMPSLDKQEFYLYKKSANPGTTSNMGGFIILVGKLDWLLGEPSPRDHYWNEFVKNSVDLLFHPPNPLPLDPSTFDTAAETMYNAAMWLESAANRLQNEADQVKSGSSGFQGAAADAFVQVIDNLRDEMRMLRQDLNTNQDWVGMLHDNATAARAFWQGLQNAWTQFSKGKDPSGMLSDVMHQMEVQVDANNRNQGSDPRTWTGSVNDSWIFNLDIGNGSKPYNLADPGALGVLNQDMQTNFRQQLQVLDQTLQAQLSRLRNGQETTRSNMHDTRQYVPPNSPTGNGNGANVDFPPPPGGGAGDNVPNTPPGGGGGGNVDFPPPPGGGAGDSSLNAPPGGGGGGNVDFTPPPGGVGGNNSLSTPPGGGGGGNVDFTPPPGGVGGNNSLSTPPGGGGGGNVDFTPPPGGVGGNLDFTPSPNGGGSFGGPPAGGGDSFQSVPPLGGASFGGGAFSGPGSRSAVRTGGGPDGGVGRPDLPTSIDPSTTDPGGAGGEFPSLTGPGTPGGTQVFTSGPPSGEHRPAAGGLFPDNSSQVPGGPNLPGDLGPPIPGLGGGPGGTDGGLTNTVQPLNGFRIGPAPAVPGSEGSPGGLGPGGGVFSSVGRPSDGSTTPGNGGTPFYPPMGGGMGGGGAGGDQRERERTTWLAEEEDVWGTDPDVVPAVIGRDDTEEYVEDDGSVRRPVLPVPAPAPGAPARGDSQTGGRGH